MSAFKLQEFYKHINSKNSVTPSTPTLQLTFKRREERMQMENLNRVEFIRSGQDHTIQSPGGNIIYLEDVPMILLQLRYRLLEKGGLKAEGIFRCIPNTCSENQLYRDPISKDLDMYSLAGLIMLWFKSRKPRILDPIFPWLMHYQTAALEGHLPQQEAVELNWALNLMADVVQLSHMNRMTSDNIARCFAPYMTTLYPSEIFQFRDAYNGVVKFLTRLIKRTLRGRVENGHLSAKQRSHWSSLP